MKYRSQLIALVIVLLALQTSSSSKADIDGFDFSLWQYNQNDDGNPASVGNDFIQLTNGTSQQRSFWYTLDQNIQAFKVSFNYRVAGGAFFSNAGGTTFVIQDAPEGLDAVTNTNFDYGYGGIEESVGVTFELNAATGQSFVGFNDGGTIGSGATATDPHSPGGNGYLVTINYDGTLLQIHIDNGVNTPFSQTLLVTPSIAESVGSGKAIIGFGASTASNLDQTISNFSFTSTAKPMLGDVNGDGCVDLLDVQPFVDALSSGQYVELADINMDGTLDLLDVEPFVNLLAGN